MGFCRGINIHIGKRVTRKERPQKSVARLELVLLLVFIISINSGITAGIDIFDGYDRRLRNTSDGRQLCSIVGWLC